MPGGANSASYMELKRILAEISDRLLGVRVAGLYHLEDDSIVLKLRSESFSGELRIVPGRFLYLVEGSYEKPSRLSQKGRALRTLVENARIVGVRLIEGERIAVLDLDRRGSKLRMVCELLPKGTILILDEDDRILACLHKLEMRDRRIAPGERYVPPPAKPAPECEKLEEILGRLTPRKSVVSALAAEARLGGRYAEEVLHLAGVDFSKRVRDLSGEEVDRIISAARKVLKSIRGGEPVVAYSPEGEAQALPYPMKILEARGWRFEKAGSLNEAFRLAYEHELAKRLEEERGRAVEREVEELERRAREKEFSANRLLEEASELRRIAEKLFSLSTELEHVKDEPGGREFDGLRIIPEPAERILRIEAGGRELELRLDQSIMRQISELFDKAKKAEAAAERLLREARELRSRAGKLRKGFKKALEDALLRVSARLRPGEGRWYERYRWFISSEGFLAVAGKDASSNVSLLKKHLEPDDLVFHAEVRGAAVVILKNGRRAGEASRREAAQFAAAYSRAWRDELSTITVYYVSPDQISFKPPPGHYLPRGGFIVKGARTYLQARLELAIGAAGDLGIVYGPPDAVKARAKRLVKLAPGRSRAEQLAEEVVRRLFPGFELDPRTRRDLKSFIAELIPYGRGRILPGGEGI